jgi:hypothetical protein
VATPAVCDVVSANMKRPQLAGAHIGRERTARVDAWRLPDRFETFKGQPSICPGFRSTATSAGARLLPADANNTFWGCRLNDRHLTELVVPSTAPGRAGAGRPDRLKRLDDFTGFLLSRRHPKGRAHPARIRICNFGRAPGATCDVLTNSIASVSLGDHQRSIPGNPAAMVSAPRTSGCPVGDR